MLIFGLPNTPEHALPERQKWRLKKLEIAFVNPPARRKPFNHCTFGAGYFQLVGSMPNRLS